MCIKHLEPSYSDIDRPPVDPELMIRMLIVGYCYGIRHERRLCEEVRLHLAYRWFFTPAGRDYLVVIREALDHIGAGTERLLQRQGVNVLTVSTSLDFAAKWLVHRLARFAAAYPDRSPGFRDDAARRFRPSMSPFGTAMAVGWVSKQHNCARSKSKRAPRWMLDRGYRGHALDHRRVFISG